MKTIGNERPVEIEILGNRKLVSFDIKEITNTNEDGSTYTMFEYEQLIFNISLDDENIEKEVSKYKAKKAIEELNATDWKVIRELERLMLVNTELNSEREALRATV
jgi:hypothetical protein